jgi:hypothetical protein
MKVKMTATEIFVDPLTLERTEVGEVIQMEKESAARAIQYHKARPATGADIEAWNLRLAARKKSKEPAREPAKEPAQA